MMTLFSTTYDDAFDDIMASSFKFCLAKIGGDGTNKEDIILNKLQKFCGIRNFEPHLAVNFDPHLPHLVVY